VRLSISALALLPLIPLSIGTAAAAPNINVIMTDDQRDVDLLGDAVLPAASGWRHGRFADRVSLRQLQAADGFAIPRARRKQSNALIK
jgi:hypothetical protein